MATVLPVPREAGYRQTTQAAALGMLAERLEDRGYIYWTQAELRLYLAEALRTWQAYTSWYRRSSTLDQAKYLSSSRGATWYDLTQSVSGLENTLSSEDLTRVMLYHLLEVPRRTEQFPGEVIQSALQNRYRRFRADVGLVSYVLQAAGVTPPQCWNSGVRWNDLPPIQWGAGAGRVRLDGITGAIDVRRVAWVDSTGQVRNLWRANEWEMNSFLGSWRNPSDPPQVYSLAVEPPLVLQLAPPPIVLPGVLEILAVTPDGPVPDHYTWGVKWGALADLLSGDAEQKDLARATYCEQRYRESVELLRSFPSLVNARAGNRPLWLGSVFEMDAFATGWQNTPHEALGLAGYGLLAASGVGRVTFDLVANFPVPYTDDEYLNLPADVVHAVVDYAQHLASFKMGGDEFFATEQQRSNFVQLAAAWNGRLRQLNFYHEAVRAPASKHLAPVPRIEVPDLTAPGYGAAVRKAGANGG